MQSQVTFNRVPEKALGGFGAEPGQVQQGSGEGFGEGSWCKAKSGSTGSGEGCREGPGAGPGQVPTCSTGFPALGFSACFRKICKNKRCGCLLGYHRSLFFCSFSMLGQKSGDQFPSRHPLQKVYPATFLGHRSAAESLGPEAEPPQIGRMISWPNCSGQLLSPAEDSTEGTRVLIHEP